MPTKKLAPSSLHSLADLLPTTGRFTVAVRLGPESLREARANDGPRRAHLRNVPPAFVSGALAADGTTKALAALAEARAASSAAHDALRTATSARAALPGDSTPGEVEEAEVAKRDATRALAAAQRVTTAAEVAAVTAIYDVPEDLAARRREAYATARTVAVLQAREALVSLTESLSMIAADDYVNPASDASRVILADRPAGSEHLHAITEFVAGLKTEDEEEAR
ncbi:hypothetical protein ATJ88_2871 [Isoptericola jiangsuensis]|uniref:Uncharacterized protein n=1 Tax=Isoptericola jiangsuensis TaxID=548579 RepID=A0A2A9EZH6_9MICO|nr:hypothetical protein [Isoptericola jiangsuensis]PFG44153.1 hypothetical protein ATJ88_2871 [Isoptericola jiangsuensis]